jgi:hypothetical protein
MKKVAVILFVFILALTAFAYADMSAPSGVVYVAYISNPDGAEYKVNNQIAGTIPFQTKIICQVSDYSIQEPFTIPFCLEGETLSTKWEERKIISASDITINDISTYKLGEKRNARVFDKDAKLYDIPNNNIAGKVITSVPFETDIIVQEYQVDTAVGAFDNDWSRWYYTSYNGNNGWIIDSSFAVKEERSNINVTSKNMITDKGTFVPMYTEMKEIYEYRGENHWSGVFYYNNEPVSINLINDIAYKISDSKAEDSYKVLFSGVSLYEQANVASKKVVEDIPVDTVLVPEYCVEYNVVEWIGTTYNGIKGWLYTRL